MHSKWTAADVPDQSGRVAVITGANRGVGFEAAAVLAAKGMHVVLAVRSTDRGKEAAARITARSPHADVALQRLDLASLESVRAAAHSLKAAYERIDVLINNAGVLSMPKRTTEDGFELHFGTNHLGHFALSGMLLDRMLLVPDSRIVTVSSLGHRIFARIDFDDIEYSRSYNVAAAYGGSKLANLLFTYELQRRLSGNAATIAVAAHPGGSKTGLTRDLPPPARVVAASVMAAVFQDSAMGALPMLRAATDPAVLGGQFYGPRGFGQQRGYPTVVASSPQSHDEQLQRRLWAVSEELTGVRYPV